MSRSVLIVDDENIPRETLANYVDWKKFGISRVWQAEDGEAALEIAIRENPYLVISDIKMPRMNGLKLAEQLRIHCPECLFVFLSGYADKENLKEAIKLKAARFVEKPIDINEITDVITELITQTEAFSEKPHVTERFFGVPDNYLLNNKIFQLEKVSLREFDQSLKACERSKAEGWFNKLVHNIGECQGTDIEYIRNVFRQIVFSLSKAAEFHRLTVLSLNAEHQLRQIQAAVTISEISNSVFSEMNNLFIEIEKLNTLPIVKIKTYLDEHYSDTDISIQSIANIFNFTPNYLCILFKKHFEMTITQYLTDLRIAKAKELLCQTKTKLYSVALQVGYTDGKYFTRVFTKATGINPRQYRERHCNEEK